MKKAILWSLCLPANLLAWLFCGVTYAFWGRCWAWENGSDSNAPRKLCVYLEQGTWPARTWFRAIDGMCCGPNAVLFSPRVLDKKAAAVAWGKSHGSPAAHKSMTVHRHEFHHCKQAEATAMYSAFCLIALLLSGASPGVTSALIVASWPLKALTANANAWLRGKAAYRGSVLEESAYAVEEKPKKQVTQQ